MARRPTKFISLTGDHVFMPADPTTPSWKDSVETKAYPGKVYDEATERHVRPKYEVHAELANFLIGRDQAMEVPADDAAE